MDRSLDGKHFDAVIIGAGMSGLAAGIRLAHFGKEVLIVEKHNAPGGLNSFYSLNGRKFDVGLHALTNYVPPGVKGTALGKILKQLRIRREELDLSEQVGSRITFPGESLFFDNDFSHFETEVARAFPKSIDGFRRFVAELPTMNDPALFNRMDSARAVLAGYIADDALIEMILCPCMYYGSASPHDLDFCQFAILFRSLFLEGFARPYAGIRPIIRLLLDKYRALGGKRKMKCGVSRLEVDGGRVRRIHLENRDCVTAETVLSSAGLVETMCLVGKAGEQDDPRCHERLGFAEAMTILDAEPSDLGWKDTIIFFSTEERFHYEPSREPVDVRSGVICIPNNYRYSGDKRLEEGWLRITSLANYDYWSSLEEARYYEEKVQAYEALTQNALKILPSLKGQSLDDLTKATDMFTPRTVTKFTSHLRGAIYGSLEKAREGRTELQNLYLCGTDQGLLGITGALLSGVTMANAHVLNK